MILLSDLDFLTDVAENKTGLYNMITEELGLDEKQQEMLVAELREEIDRLQEDNEELRNGIND